MSNYVFAASLAACLFTLFAYVAIWARLRDDNERDPMPKVTLVIWFLVEIGLAIPAKDATFLLMWTYVIGSGVIALYALFYGKGGWSWLDTTLLLFALAATLAWMSTKGVLAIVLLVIAAVIGANRLICDMWKRPDVHGKWAWRFFWLGGLCGIIALALAGRMRTIEAVAPLSFFPVQTLMLVLVHRRPRPFATAQVPTGRPTVWSLAA